jgi:hypothetical protein
MDCGIAGICAGEQQLMGPSAAPFRAERRGGYAHMVTVVCDPDQLTGAETFPAHRAQLPMPNAVPVARHPQSPGALIAVAG